MKFKASHIFKGLFLTAGLACIVILFIYQHSFQKRIIEYESAWNNEPPEVERKGEENYPLYVYLTWSRPEMSTTMTIHYHTLWKPKKVLAFVDTKSRSQKDRGEYKWTFEGKSKVMSGWTRTVNYIELTKLKPAQTYYFRVGNSSEGLSREFKFRTLPSQGPLRMVVGGDMGVGPHVERLNRQGASQNPHFALVGGDIAYADGLIWKYTLWDQWLYLWQKHMVTPAGHLIPMVVAIGNHELDGGYGGDPEDAPFYYNYFYQGGKSYFLRTLGKRLLLVTLDTNHTHSHSGVQLDWLKEILEKNKDFPLKLALYHYPMYPSHRRFGKDEAQAGRTYWKPLFEKYRFQVGFENHDHTLKRTKRLWKEKVDEKKGILYIGDGAWGRPPRTVDKKRWYIAEAKQKRHIWIVEIKREEIYFRALSEEGKTLDEYTLPLEGAGK